MEEVNELDSVAPRKLSPIPQRMLDLLSDGKEHTLDELKEIVDDKESSSVQFHLNSVRQHLSPLGGGILCSYGLGVRGKGSKIGGSTYRLVKNAKRVNGSLT